MLLGIDLGTSYLKAGVFDEKGQLHGLGRIAVHADTPAPDHRELSLRHFLERLREAVTEAVQKAAVAPESIAAISYGSQANTFLWLDHDGEALTPLIFWNDRRAYPLSAELQEHGTSEEFRQRTGLWKLAPESMPAKSLWLARTFPEAQRRCASVMTVSDYLTFFLTDQRVGDASTAALTGLYDLQSRGWWPDALSRFSLDRSQLSAPLLPGTRAGELTQRAAHFFGLHPGTPVAAGALDHHAAALGSGLGVQVEASLSSGTVLAALILTDTLAPAPGCIHGPHTEGKPYYVLAFDPTGAGRLEDYQRLHAPEVPLSELLARLEQGEFRDKHVEKLRQLLEEIAQTEKDLLERIAPGKRFTCLAATGGGARSPISLQIKAETFGAQVISTSPEPACLGAAALGSVGAGLYPSLEKALQQLVHPLRVANPVVT